MVSGGDNSVSAAVILELYNHLAAAVCSALPVMVPELLNEVEECAYICSPAENNLVREPQVTS